MHRLVVWRPNPGRIGKVRGFFCRVLLADDAIELCADAEAEETWITYRRSAQSFPTSKSPKPSISPPIRQPTPREGRLCEPFFIRCERIVVAFVSQGGMLKPPVVCLAVQLVLASGAN